MNCVWVRSANPQDPLSTVCDLSRRRTLCSGHEENCECPNLLDAEMMLQYEREKEIDAHQNWLEICDYTDHVNGGR